MPSAQMEKEENEMASREEMNKHTDIESYLEVVREAIDRLYHSAIVGEYQGSIKHRQADVDSTIAFAYLKCFQDELEKNQGHDK